jgi:hypothetical protein
MAKRASTIPDREDMPPSSSSHRPHATFPRGWVRQSCAAACLHLRSALSSSRRRGNGNACASMTRPVQRSEEWIMSDPAESQARRRFLKIAMVGAATAPLAAALLPRIGFAADLPHLDPNDATAKALAYTEDAGTAKANPTFKPGSACASCQFFQGAAADEYGPCLLFPGKAVHSKGWCASYNKKA